jgi:hypothetical protein
MPELYQDIVPFYSAFNMLSTSRRSVFGIGYIPMSEIRGYLDELGVYQREERLEWISWIRFIDAKYVEIQANKNDKKSKSADHSKSATGSRPARPKPRK